MLLPSIVVESLCYEVGGIILMMVEGAWPPPPPPTPTHSLRRNHFVEHINLKIEKRNVHSWFTTPSSNCSRVPEPVMLTTTILTCGSIEVSWLLWGPHFATGRLFSWFYFFVYSFAFVFLSHFDLRVLYVGSLLSPFHNKRHFVTANMEQFFQNKRSSKVFLACGWVCPSN